ncbi:MULTISPECIES: LysR family transcriptional regulator [Pseudomonas]|uniref:LysR family transcriptional regulator n=1 Tax=Pseudomonas TaxID=286 RepID=UPI0008A2BD7E|nr:MULTISPECIES: LysR family transcriptional regulator [Pseudomonas]MBF8758131.1 LysR family transcriptional regulator [Pseudomonas guariconensis]OFS76372.1 LysR family transcriptional regulator [Pseudomonas sp. HMSC08G10]
MTPEQLITFATVAEHGNISHAAAALHLSQPAVSGQLKLLQEAFGEPLYQRAGRGVRLTAAGEQLLGHAQRLRETFLQAQALRDAMRGMERGTLRIGASTTPASYLLPYLIADFHARYPDIAITTTHGNTAEIVAALGELDIALIEGPPGQELPLGTSVTAWREDEIVAIVPSGHPLADGAQVQTLQALGAYPLVLRESGSGVRQLVERAFAREGVPMRVALEIAGVEGVKEAVRAGMGIGFVSAMSIRHEDSALYRLGIAPQPLTRRFSILMPHAATPSRAAGRFMGLCLGIAD